MGVLGLVPYLQKISPHVLKSVPSRFREMRGKVVVFDATLITQRLHFAPVPHDFRHVLGWYKLIGELHDNGVRAICVFDGKERNIAKQREVMRRRQQKMASNARGAMEMQRLSRLAQLRSLTASYELLSEEEKAGVATLLQTLARDFPVDQRRIDELGGDPSSMQPRYLWGYTETSGVPDVPPWPVSRGDRLDSTPAEMTRVKDSPVDGPTRVSSMLAALYSGFLSSAREMSVLLPPRTVLPRPEEREDETGITTELSRAQRLLVAEEESVWKRLLEGTSEEDPEENVSFMARELEDKSARILTSYERRNHLPTGEVYDQCRIILQAMGVPCIEAEGGVEGEALAAALVRDGLADYVASEDTDVLVYGAPLLRNVTTSTEPLILIEGYEVRDALDMDIYQFLDFALLLGTDFTDRIPNIGPIRASKFILSYGSIENILEGEPKYTPKTAVSEYLEQVRAARSVFQLRPTLPTLEQPEALRPTDSFVIEVLQRFRLQRFAERDTDFSSLIGTNYFSDHP